MSFIRSLCEEVFQKFSEYERIEKFSRPKVLRLLEILRLYRPQIILKNSPCNEGQNTTAVVNNEEADLSSAQTEISVHCTESLLKQNPQTVTSALPLPSFRRKRPDFSTRHHRNRDDLHQLCSIIFAEKRNTAKLLYHLLKVCLSSC